MIKYVCLVEMDLYVNLKLDNKEEGIIVVCVELRL